MLMTSVIVSVQPPQAIYFNIFFSWKMQNGDRHLTVPNELTTLKSSMQKTVGYQPQSLEDKTQKSQWIQVN